MRGHFALRFGDLRGEDDRGIGRAALVREAFNSPFWPFVLATTSVGQEGLDFHLYCHAVVHWNLPSNPVDPEQREGRSHRYQGHAVRKNLARAYGLPEACAGADQMASDCGGQPLSSPIVRAGRDVDSTLALAHDVIRRVQASAAALRRAAQPGSRRAT